MRRPLVLQSLPKWLAIAVLLTSTFAGDPEPMPTEPHPEEEGTSSSAVKKVIQGTSATATIFNTVVLMPSLSLNQSSMIKQTNVVLQNNTILATGHVNSKSSSSSPDTSSRSTQASVMFPVSLNKQVVSSSQTYFSMYSQTLESSLAHVSSPSFQNQITKSLNIVQKNKTVVLSVEMSPSVSHNPGDSSAANSSYVSIVSYGGITPSNAPSLMKSLLPTKTALETSTLNPTFPAAGSARILTTTVKQKSDIMPSASIKHMNATESAGLVNVSSTGLNMQLQTSSISVSTIALFPSTSVSKLKNTGYTATPSLFSTVYSQADYTSSTVGPVLSASAQATKDHMNETASQMSAITSMWSFVPSSEILETTASLAVGNLSVATTKQVKLHNRTSSVILNVSSVLLTSVLPMSPSKLVSTNISITQHVQINQTSAGVSHSAYQVMTSFVANISRSSSSTFLNGSSIPSATEKINPVSSRQVVNATSFHSTSSIASIGSNISASKMTSLVFSSTPSVPLCANCSSLNTTVRVMPSTEAVLNTSPSVLYLSSFTQQPAYSTPALPSLNSSASLARSVVSTVSSKATQVRISPSSRVMPSSSVSKIRAPTASPQNVTAYNLSSTSIYVSWQPLPPGTLNGILHHYEVLIKKKNSTVTNSPSISKTLYHSKTMMTAGQLTSTVHSSRGISRSMVSSVINVAATSMAPLQPVEPTEEPHPPTEASIMVTFSAGLSLNITIKHLEIWTLYEVYVRAVTMHAGPFSFPVTARTDEDVPSAPTHLLLKSLNASAVSLAWKAPLKPNGYLTGYVVSYKVNGSDTTTMTSVHLKRNYNITQLAPFSTYIIQVAASTRKGRGGWVSISYKTPVGRPSSPRNATASSLNSSVIQLTWSRPKFPNGHILYLVYMGPVQGDQPEPRLIYEGLNTVFTVYGLAAYKDYMFTVYTRNDQDRALVSEPAVVIGRTKPAIPSGAPLDVHATIQTSKSALVCWKPPHVDDWNGPILHYSVEYRTDHGPYGTKSTQGNTTCLLVTSLIPYTKYYFTVKVVNIVGIGPGSEVVSNTTFDDAPSPPTKVQAITTGPSSIRVQWSKPLHPNGALIKYKVFYRLASENVSANVLKYDGEDTVLLVKQLEEYHQYVFTVMAYNERIGKSSDAVIVKQSTHPAAPTAPPRNVKTTSQSSTSIRVTWDPPVTSEINGKLTGYLLTYNTSDGSMVNRSLPANQTKLIITRLRAYTVYYVRVRAVNGVGAGPASHAVYCRTKEDVPGPVVFGEVRNITSTILLVTWSPPVNPNGIINAYKLCWSPQGSTRRPTCYFIGGTRHSFNVTGLESYSPYVIFLRAHNLAGFGPAVSGTYRTDQGVPTRVLNLSAWNTSSQAIFVRWSPPVKSNGILTKYQVTYKRNGSSQLINAKPSGLSTTLTLTRLDAYTLYYIYVSACTRGCGEQAMTSATTGEGVPGPVTSLSFPLVGINYFKVQWSLPVKPRGKIGFYVDYWKTNEGSIRRIVVPHGSLSQLVTSLESFTNYTVSVVPYNLASSVEGAFSLSYVETLPAAPEGPPTNLVLVQATSTSLEIRWSPPDKPNGVIERYRVVVFENEKPSNKVRQTTVTTECTIAGLRPWRVYAVQIACESSGGVGPSSPIKTFRTTASVPPTIPPLKPPDESHISSHEIVLELVQASDVNGKISYYQVIVLELLADKDGLPIHPAFPPVHYTPKDLVTYQTAQALRPKLVPYITGQFPAGEFERHRKFVVGRGNDSSKVRKRRDADEYYNGPLTPGTYYTVFQRAYVSKDLYTSGPWIDPVTTAEASDPESRRKSSGSSSGLIVGLSVTFGVLILVLIVVLAFVWKKRRFEFGVMLDDNGDYTGRTYKLKKLRRRRTSNKGLMGSTDSLDALDDLARNRGRRQPIPIEQFAAHVRRMHTDGDIGFSEEYELVQPNDEGFTWHHSLHSANKFKNRYANIIAYDHSRVLLAPIEGFQESDYINANYIDGYNRSGAFIASQGPLPETFNDFWRMVWEQGSAIIVMLTQLEERGRRKCDHYWPDRGTQNYGHIRVTANETFHMSYYVLRTFMLSHMQVEEEEPREVRQYHFTSWPDHGVPTHPAPLLSMVRTVSQANPPTAGPMVVHCSAGVGRTGTFITLDCMLQRIAQEGTIDIYAFVRQMRTNRNLMVQTESQYVFIHDALVEAVTCGVTEVQANMLAARIRELREVDPNLGSTYMDKEFERLMKEERHPSKFKSANLGCNTAKNRYANILPYERTRVPLKMRPGEVGSDYINANYIDSNCRLRAYIATQAPVPNTFEDFWRMIWEQGSSVIVMLTREEEAGKLKCHRYWPSDGSRLYDKILVELTEELTYSDYVVRNFSMTHAEEKLTRTVRQYQYTDWPDVGLPESGVGIIDLIGQVEKWQQQSGNTCITVHCSGGVGRTGVFCAVSILIDRVKAEGLIDVFQTVQHLRLQRPAMVQTKDQFEFCYTTMQEYLESFDLYANFQ